MNEGHYIFVIVAAWLLTGCANPSLDNIEAGMPQYKSYQQRYNEKWEKYRSLTISTPETTHYNDSLELKNIYLQGYQEGVRTTLKDKGLWSIADFFPTSRTENAYADGFDAGREAVQTNIVEVIQKEISADQEAWYTTTTNYLKAHGITGPEPIVDGDRVNPPPKR